jgi:ABC-type multidrug transport system fused ATPase/permease subunit
MESKKFKIIRTELNDDYKGLSYNSVFFVIVGVILIIAKGSFSVFLLIIGILLLILFSSLILNSSIKTKQRISKEIIFDIEKKELQIYYYNRKEPKIIPFKILKFKDKRYSYNIIFYKNKKSVFNKVAFIEYWGKETDEIAKYLKELVKQKIIDNS